MIAREMKPGQTARAGYSPKHLREGYRYLRTRMALIELGGEFREWWNLDALMDELFEEKPCEPTESAGDREEDPGAGAQGRGGVIILTMGDGHGNEDAEDDGAVAG
jgi:hypothetical protein